MNSEVEEQISRLRYLRKKHFEYLQKLSNTNSEINRISNFLEKNCPHTETNIEYQNSSHGMMRHYKCKICDQYVN
jgi:hypothetical protein